MDNVLNRQLKIQGCVNGQMLVKISQKNIIKLDFEENLVLNQNGKTLEK